ncbi:MAG: hypothetical protein QM793_01325 [Muricomes sp.]
MGKYKPYKYVKKYPILIGLMLIAALMGGLVIQKYWSERPQGQWTVVPEELSREATIGQFRNPEDLIEYTIASLKNKDLDLMLRACAIDENMYSYPFSDILDKKGRFGYNMVLLPSYNYEEYRPLNSTILARYYTEQYDEFQKRMDNLGTLKLKKVGILYPENQLDSETLFQTTRLYNKWGASRGIQMGALLQAGPNYYMISFTVTKYYEYWKIFDFGIEMADMQRERFIKETNPEEFNTVIGKISVTKFIEKLNRKNLEDGDEAETEQIEDIEHPENEILPPNYFIIGASYGKEQQDTIEHFILALQKKDTIKALSYFEKENQELDTVTSKEINLQADYAKQVSCFYYGILGVPFFQGEKTLEDLNETVPGMLGKLNPYPFRYVYIKGILKVADNKASSEEQYVTFYKFNGKYYVSGYTLTKQQDGWQIKSLSASEQKLKEGEVREISKEKYYKWIGDEYKKYPY